MKFCIGPMSRAIVDATIEYANTQKTPMILIPSRRQVDWNGGYVGWTTQEFAEYVRSRTSYVRLERDHGGPGQGTEDDDGFESLAADCTYLDIIHIDPWKKYPRFDEGLEWTIKMIEFCYDRNPAVRYEVGTEQGIRPFEVDELGRLIAALKERLTAKMFAQIEFVVIQCGTQLIEKSNCGAFDEAKLAAMLTLVHSYGKMPKEHNGDWITQDTVRRKGILGLEFINIAPEMGETETAEIVKVLSEEDREAFFQICLQSGKWKKWVSKEFDPMNNKDTLTLICGHYVFMDPAFQAIRAAYPLSVRERILEKITALCAEPPPPRVAVCFFGQIRTGGVLATSSILRYIGTLRAHCDIFVHTWDTESLGTGHCYQMDEGPGPTDEHWFKVKELNTDLLSQFYSAMKPRSMQVEEFNLQPSLNKWGGRRFDPVSKKWTVCLWRSLQESNKLKMEYAAKNKIEYDYTLLMRTDIVFSPEKRLAFDIAEVPNDKTLLFADFYNVFPTWGQTRMEDVFFLARSSVIDRFAFFSDFYTNTVSNINDTNDPAYRDWQLYCAKWITQTLGISFHPLSNSTIRVYSLLDRENGVDPLNPGFGNPPGTFGRKR
jgi:fructose/tagatose bisphosphate aldolase